MARPLRITFPGAFYHTTSRGNGRKALFSSRKDRGKFLEYFESATERHGAIIHAFCLIDNHYHLLLETPDGIFLRSFATSMGAHHLFQCKVEKDAYAEEVSRYIHLNQFRAGTVKRRGECGWFSCNYYIR